MLVTFSLLTAVTLSHLAIKLVYQDAFCLSSDYKEVLVLLCHPTERVPKIDTNCHIFDQFLSISSKMHNLLGLFNIYWKSVPSTIRNFQDCLQPTVFPLHGYQDGWILPQTMRTSRAKGKKYLVTRDNIVNSNWIEGKTTTVTWFITRKAGSLQPLRYWKFNWTIPWATWSNFKGSPAFIRRMNRESPKVPSNLNYSICLFNPTCGPKGIIFNKYLPDL